MSRRGVLVAAAFCICAPQVQCTVPLAQVHEGRDLCAAAHEHLAILEPQIREQQQKSGLTDTDIRLRFENLKAELPVFKSFSNQDKPTEVVQMNMPESLRQDILNDIYQARRVEKTLRKLMNATVTGYNPFKLEFDWAAPFVPSCAEFMNVNRDLVRQYFPEVHTCQCNAFIVEKDTNAYGFHSASAAGYEYGYLFNNGVLAPEYQMSFHTAVSATNLSSNPFTIFDTVTPEVFNNHFLAQHFKSIESSIPVETMMLLRAAVVMYEEKTSITHVRVFMDYLHAMYYATAKCGNDAPRLTGNYWDLEPGQALYFNNWRVHGDSGLGSSEYDRVTMDLRCFSETKVPAAFSDSYDWTRRLSPHMVNTYEKAAECLLKLFNYTSSEEFLETVFGREMPNGVSYYAGVGNLGLNDAGVTSLMHEDSLAGMRRHAGRVRDGYAHDNLNYDAFMTCYQENIVAFDERFKEAPLPWSWADRVLTYPKLYFAFAPAQLHVIVVVCALAAFQGAQMCTRRRSSHHLVQKMKTM